MIAPPYETPLLSPWLRWQRLLLLGLPVLFLGWLAWEAMTWPDVAALATRRPVTTKLSSSSTATAPGSVRFRAPSSAEVGPLLPHLAQPQARRAVRRRHGILLPPRFRERRDEGGARGRLGGEAPAARRLDHHSATGQEPLAVALAQLRCSKLKEAALTRQLEAHLGKRRILELYLNVVELGPGIFGAEAAARHYFGKSAAALGEREAAQLAASLPLPSAWHPGADNRAYRRHVQTVLHRMSLAGWLWQPI